MCVFLHLAGSPFLHLPRAFCVFLVFLVFALLQRFICGCYLFFFFFLCKNRGPGRGAGRWDNLAGRLWGILFFVFGIGKEGREGGKGDEGEMGGGDGREKGNE